MPHTPGSWRIEARTTAQQRLKSASTVAITANHAIVSDAHGKGDAEEFEANARLIAAAPHMLAALEAAEDFTDHAAACMAGPDCQCPVAIIRIAIAKARGR